MVNLIFVTGNVKKLKQAQKAVAGYPIKLIRKTIETPEIQETDCRKIAEFSAKYTSQKIGKPVVVTDAGYYIHSLNGFPGPFIKFINQWLKPSDLLRLMKGITDRTVDSPVCVSYCTPAGKPVSFVSKNKGVIAKKSEGNGSTIDRLYIPHGHTHPIGVLPENERLTIWNNDCWKQLAEYLTKGKTNSSAQNKGI